MAGHGYARPSRRDRGDDRNERRQRRSSGRRRASKSTPPARAASSRAREPAAPPAAKACGADCRASSSARWREWRCRAKRLSLRRPSKDPRQQLPVAARPSVVPARADVIAGREFFDDLDIGGEAGAREYALEQVVAEKGRVRRAARQRRLERIDIIDALSRVGAFAEQILVDVGDRGGIGVDAAQAGEDALKQRTFAADRQRGRDARLQDSIALDHPARRRSRGAAG